MKTLLISSFHPIIARNVLFTQLPPLLTKEGIHIAIVVPDFKKEYFIKNFASPTVTIVPLPTTLSPRTLFFRWLALALLNSRTLYIKKRADLYRTHKILPFLISVSLSTLFGRSRFFVNIIRAIDYKLTTHDGVKKIFDSVHPDLVFSTDVQNEIDVALMHEAKRRGVATVGMVRSWDNLSSKGLIRVIPDKLIVHNELIAKEAVTYNFVDSRKIVITGIPHYDRYLLKSLGTKEAFFEKYGFDVTQPVVLFSPVGDRYIRNNRLDQLVLDTLSKNPWNILVRFPPCDEVALTKPTTSNARIAFEYTGVSYWEGGPKVNEIDKSDDDTLIAELTYSNVLVSGQSTLAVDACLFDVPVVVINFDQESRNYYDSIKRYYDGEYYRLVKESGAERIANSPKELTSFVESYINNRSLDKDARQKVVADRAYKLDGHSTDRLFRELTALLKV